jgi:carbon storage regulator
VLILSRQRNESVMIGNDIIITVAEIRGDKVRLGFSVPKVIPVHRKEVYDKISGEAVAGGEPASK